MYTVTLKNISKSFGKNVVLDNISLEIPAGELFFLLGSSGCGKTTLLRILAGFEKADSGQVFFDNRDVTNLAPQKRAASMVFQSYALWPHLTVEQNVAFGLENRKLDGPTIKARVKEALQLVHLDDLGARLPNQLSGGQQQRVALARALVVGPNLLLLDEPLSNLDARLRGEMRIELLNLHRKTGVTAVYVTHDQEEALSLADRIAFLDNGKLVQAGPPRQMYSRPATVAAARFLGAANIVSGSVASCSGSIATIETVIGTLRAALDSGQTASRNEAVSCFFRPESLKPCPKESATLSGMVQASMYNGSHEQVYLKKGDFEFRATIAVPFSTTVGNELAFSLDPTDVVILKD